MNKIESLLHHVEANLQSIGSHESEDFASGVFANSLRQNRDELIEELQKPQLLEWEETPIAEAATNADPH